jgi:hypothetical protein
VRHIADIDRSPVRESGHRSAPAIAWNTAEARSRSYVELAPKIR